MPNIGIPELVIVLLIVLLLFGGKRLPGIARSLGEGINEFKDSVTGKRDERESGDVDRHVEPPALEPPSSDAGEPVSKGKATESKSGH